jgi:hypothetical protein
MNLFAAFYFQFLLTSSPLSRPAVGSEDKAEKTSFAMLAEAERFPLPGLPPFASTPSEAKGSPGRGKTSLKAAGSGKSGTPPEDVEALRIETELRQVEKNPQARQRFFSQIREVIRRVRMGEPLPSRLRMTNLDAFPPATPDKQESTAPLDLRAPSDEALPANAWAPTREQPGTWSKFTLPSNPGSAARPQPSISAPVNWISPNGDSLGAPTVNRLLYWARVNGCPPELALAEAWQESRLNPHAGRGGAGEVGMMQILPGRAKLEGVDPRRLQNPDVNMWLGTKLLARYYRQEGSTQAAAMMYVAGPGVFQKHYASNVEDYINWYAASVQDADNYFARYFQATP